MILSRVTKAFRLFNLSQTNYFLESYGGYKKSPLQISYISIEVDSKKQQTLKISSIFIVKTKLILLQMCWLTAQERLIVSLRRNATSKNMNGLMIYFHPLKD